MCKWGVVFRVGESQDFISPNKFSPLQHDMSMCHWPRSLLQLQKQSPFTVFHHKRSVHGGRAAFHSHFQFHSSVRNKCEQTVAWEKNDKHKQWGNPVICSALFLPKVLSICTRKKQSGHQALKKVPDTVLNFFKWLESNQAESRATVSPLISGCVSVLRFILKISFSYKSEQLKERGQRTMKVTSVN